MDYVLIMFGIQRLQGDRLFIPNLIFVIHLGLYTGYGHDPGNQILMEAIAWDQIDLQMRNRN